MKSPFPGMDPFVEAHGCWGDFHGHLIEKIYDVLVDNVPEHYTVRNNERSYVALAEGKTGHPFIPDVRITSRDHGSSPESAGATLAEPATEADPIVMRAFAQEEYREAFIEIIETDPEERLVTSIEVLSPTNKRPGTPGWELFLRKRQGLLAGGVNVVEIDLLRCGQRMPMRDPWPTSPYTILVYRSGVLPRCHVWRAHFRTPVPSFPVPLVPPDKEIEVNLQPMIDTIYARSRYYRTIDYAKPLDAPWSDDDAAWLSERLIMSVT